MTRVEFYYILRSSVVLMILVFPIVLLVDWLFVIISDSSSIDLLKNLHSAYLLSILLAYTVVIKKALKLSESALTIILRVVLLNTILLGFLFLILTFDTQNEGSTKSFNYLLFDLSVILVFDVFKLKKSLSK